MKWLTKFFKHMGQERPHVLPGKNDLCWCGSGIKYKKCHLLKDKLYLKENPVKNNKRTKPVRKSCSTGFG